MSSKKKTHGTRASQDDGRRKAEYARAMETARELHARREAAQGPAPIDNELLEQLRADGNTKVIRLRSSLLFR